MLKMLITLIIGALIGIIFGPMITGAVGSAFWSRASDTNDLQDVAYRLYGRADILLPSDAFETVERSPCLEEFENYVFAKETPKEAIELLWSLKKTRQGIIQAKYDDLAIKSLEGLPAPILGALDGCIGGSPASDICLNYIADRTRKAVSISRATQQRWITMADRQMVMPWCAAKAMSFSAQK